MQRSNPTSPVQSPARSPTAKESGNGFEKIVLPDETRQSTIVRLVLTPITFVSFLISLFLIDTHNYSQRMHSTSHQHQHQQPNSPPTTRLGKMKALLHSIVYAPSSRNGEEKSRRVGDASPYAYVRNPGTGKEDEKIGMVGVNEFSTKSTAGAPSSTTNSSSRASSPLGSPPQEQWYYSTKQKKMMRAEFADAFRIRRWVVLFLVVCGGGVLVLGWMVMGLVSAWAWGGLGAVGFMSWGGSILAGGGGENRLGKDW